MIEVDGSNLSQQAVRCFQRDGSIPLTPSKRLLKLADSSSVFAVCDVTMIQGISFDEFDVLLSESNMTERFVIQNVYMKQWVYAC